MTAEKTIRLATQVEAACREPVELAEPRRESAP
jgi:hypothetical protein